MRTVYVNLSFSPCEVRQTFHLQQSRLIQRTGIDINTVSVHRGAVCQHLVILNNFHK